MAEIKTILFPTDFSEFSNKAFPFAAEIAKAFEARLVLMHVSELEEEDPANPAHSFAPLADLGEAVETERVVVRGHAPYKDILDLSRSKNCDLIVMATHGRSALSQFFLGGSIAEEVARFSRIPVFIVKIEADAQGQSYTGRLKEILFTTDLSDASALVFPCAKLFAEKFSAKLFALHVIEENDSAFYESKGLSTSDADFKSRVEELLKQYISSLEGGEAVTSAHVVEGRAEEEIVRFAEEHQIDLIAISMHGHTGLAEEIIGTTTDRVIRHAHCPVITARG
ncbi:MAG: universal stress protein [Acidobacteriota bacterium]